MINYGNIYIVYISARLVMHDVMQQHMSEFESVNPKELAIHLPSVTQSDMVCNAHSHISNI